MKSSYVLFALGAGAAAMAALPQAGLAINATGDASGNYVQPTMHHEPYGEVNIVVPLTTDDKAVQGMKLRNLENTLNVLQQWGGTAHSAVVLYAKGVSLLKAPDQATRDKIDALEKRGVRFEVCNNTLREQNLDFHSLYKVREENIVPSGFAEVAYLQAKKHYVVDPAN